MNAKALSLAAACGLAATSTSIAQVYSVNLVGYVKREISPQGYCILAVPLNGSPNNNINSTIQLPHDGTYDGTSIYRFNRPTQAYRETIQWISNVGWLASDPEDLILNPGEGFFMQNVASVPLSLIFVGEVPLGVLNNPLPGPNAYAIRSSVVPKGGRLGWPGLPDSLEFPADDGDSVYIYDCATQRYRETYQYVSGFGWLHDVDPPEGPYIEPATGFFIQKGPSATSTTWVQSFSVN
jgi:hypothetical protein